MNLEKAGYDTVILVGTMEDFLEKMRITGDKISDIVDWQDEMGVSLFLRSLGCGKFDIAHYLLENGANVNTVSKSGNNGFHILAPHLFRFEGAAEFLDILLERGVSLNAREKRFNNTAFFSLCRDGMYAPAAVPFLEKCIREGLADLDAENIRGRSARDIILDYGPDSLKKLVGGTV